MNLIRARVADSLRLVGWGSVASVCCLASSQAANLVFGNGSAEVPSFWVAPPGSDGVGTRMNVSKRNGSFQDLGAGTYHISEFEFYARSTSGAVTPFLAVQEGSSYRVVWIGNSSTITGAEGAKNYDYDSYLNLKTAGRVYAGFFTDTAGRVGFSPTVGEGDVSPEVASTAHWSSAPGTVPTVGTLLSNPSNPNRSRSYAFAIHSTAYDAGWIGGGNRGGTTGDTRIGETGYVANRLNIERQYSRDLAAGTYQIVQFSFAGADEDILEGNQTNGQVVPFLARQTGESSFEYLWVGDAVQSAMGWTTVSLDEELELSADTKVFAGFYTVNGARVSFSNRPAENALGTAHLSGATITAGVEGGPVTFSGNTNIARHYNFEITVIPEPSTLGLASLALLAGLLRRR